MLLESSGGVGRRLKSVVIPRRVMEVNARANVTIRNVVNIVGLNGGKKFGSTKTRTYTTSRITAIPRLSRRMLSLILSVRRVEAVSPVPPILALLPRSRAAKNAAGRTKLNTLQRR